METKSGQLIIDPDKDYCSICGDPIDDMDTWITGIPLCTSCWIEDKQKEIND